MEIVAKDTAGLSIYLSEREYFALARPEGLLEGEVRNGGTSHGLKFTFGAAAVAMHLPLATAERLLQGIAGHLVDAALKRLIAGYFAEQIRAAAAL